jgi:hypothetical protein
VKRTIEAVQQIMDRHQANLMAVDGVQGVGIGAAAPDGFAIKVYVDKKRPELPSAIPARIEDVPVVVEESGVFEAG